MRCLKLQWKISHRFVGIQFGSINSSTLSFYMDPFQPAKQRWNQEYMYLQVCGPRVLEMTSAAANLDYLTRWYPDMLRKSTICKRHAVHWIDLLFILHVVSGEILEESIEFNWPSPRRLFLLAPPITRSFWHCSMSDRYFRWSWMCPNLSKCNGNRMSSQKWICSAPMWRKIRSVRLVTEVKRSHWPQLSPDCYGLRVRDEVSRQRYVQRDRCSGYFLFISSMKL